MFRVGQLVDLAFREEPESAQKLRVCDSNRLPGYTPSLVVFAKEAQVSVLGFLVLSPKEL